MIKMAMFIHRPGDPQLWQDTPPEQIIHVQQLDLALIVGGMQSGKSSVALRIPLPDGKFVIAETSFALIQTAVQGFKGATNE